MQYDFANLLFAGPCNARCYFCIGRQIDPRLSVNSLDVYPPRNLDRFVELIIEHAIRQVVFTGTNTDPQLYRHEARLLEHLRHHLPADTQISLHTNGRLALKKIDVLNQYDRVCLSFPTFDPATYFKLMGVRGVPDLAQIVERAQIPVKVSCVIDEHNIAELPDFLERCHAIGIKRLVLRRLYGDTRVWDIIKHSAKRTAALRTRRERSAAKSKNALAPRGDYRGNPVYDYRGLEVTIWNFADCECRSLNLFSDGTISDSYLLVKARK
jgi:molybdenum cofactor biosynthesis enzyme MoaA